VGVSRGRTANLKLNLINYDVTGYGVAEDENWQIIDSMVSQFIRMNGIIGTWKNSTQYTVGDVTVDIETGALWECSVSNVSSATGSFAADRASFPQRWTVKTNTGDSGNTAVSRPEDFGAASVEDEQIPDGDGNIPTPSDSTGPLQQALNNALTKGIPLQLDKTYRLKAQIVADLDSFDYLRVQGNGGLLCDANLFGEPFLDVLCSPLLISNITTVDNTATLDFGGQGNLSDCAKLTLPTGHAVTRGMLVKVVSDNPIPGAVVSSLIGEVAYIGAVSGNDVYTTARLRNTYTTNPRLAVYKSNKKVLISNITVRGDPDLNVTEDRKWLGIRVTGVVNPVFERVVSRDTSLAVLLTQGCVHTLFIGCEFERGLNNITSLGITGYGIKDNNGEYTTVLASHGHDVRHVYTCDVTTSLAPNPFTYGVPYGGIIADCQGHNCSAAAFDTHPSSESYVFDTVRTYNAYQGNNTAFAGIQAWGVRHALVDCRHEGSGAGIILGSNSPSSPNRHIIKNYHYDGTFIAIYARNDTPGAVIDVSDSTLISSYAFGVVSLFNTSMNGVDNKYTLRSATANRRVYDLRGTSTLREERPRIDLTQIASTKTWIVGYSTDTANVVSIKDVRVRAGTNPWTVIVCGDAGTPKAVSATYNIAADLAPTDTDGIDSAIAALPAVMATIFPSVTIDGANAYASGYRPITPSIVANKFSVDINNCPDGTVVREYTVTAAGASTDLFKPGLSKGQRLFVVNSPSSTQNFTIAAATTNVGLAADTAIAPKAGIGFTWNGTLWICTSIGVAVTGAPGVTDHGALTGLADDDHPQYFTSGRADAWFLGKGIGALSDVPDTLGSPGRYLRVAASGTTTEYAKALDTVPARDVAIVGPSTYATDTAGMADSCVAIYALATDNTRTALRLFANTAKAIWFQLADHARAIVAQFSEDSDGTASLRLWSAGAGVVKTVINSNYAVFGGSSADRVGSEVVTVKGDLVVTGAILGQAVGGDFTKPYIIGNIRLWDSGATGVPATANHLYAKAGGDPTTATDGSPLW
jgi:hypothetical protein